LNIRCKTTALAAFILCAGISSTALAQEADKGKDINSVCAACHGQLGQGGKKGEYPRLAGQSATFIAAQLRAFRARTRINIPMFPYTQERELPDEDIRDIAAYLASIKLSSRMPRFTGDEDALTRLEMVDKVMIVPRSEGDIANGGAIYQENCAYCHGKAGLGGGRYPMLVGQYSNYLKKQIDSYLKGERKHDDDDGRGILAELKASDIRDILAYLTSIQERD
jgi:cytochrome c553